MSQESREQLVTRRRTDPAWLLLASRNAPLVLASLKQLLEANPTGVEMDRAVEDSAGGFAAHVQDSEFDVGNAQAAEARRELRR